MVIRLKIELKELRSLFQRWMFLPSPRSLNNCFHFFAPIAELFIREMKMYERGRNAIKKSNRFSQEEQSFASASHSLDHFFAVSDCATKT